MRDPAFAYLRSRLTGLTSLHINSGARAGSRTDIADNTNFKCAKKKQFNFSLQGYFSYHYYVPLQLPTQAPFEFLKTNRTVD